MEAERDGNAAAQTINAASVAVTTADIVTAALADAQRTSEDAMATNQVTKQASEGGAAAAGDPEDALNTSNTAAPVDAAGADRQGQVVPGEGGASDLTSGGPGLIATIATVHATVHAIVHLDCGAPHVDGDWCVRTQTGALDV